MVIVFGSVNLDLSVVVEHAPGAGETVMGGALLMSGGGKGANQAHAARRHGAKVKMVGAVGTDALAATALASLERAGVDLESMRRADGLPTGTALITLDAHGENRIVVAPGANAAASADDVSDADLANARVLLLQLEVPLAQSLRLARRARGCRVILNAAPMPPDVQLDLSDIDVVIVNRIELHQLADSLGVPPGAPEARAKGLARAAACEVLLTLGAHGATLATPDGGARSLGGHAVQVVDTTGAGDTFAGVFAAACAEGQHTLAALATANAAAALSCGARGAQASQPERSAIEAFLASRSKGIGA